MIFNKEAVSKTRISILISTLFLLVGIFVFLAYTDFYDYLILDNWEEIFRTNLSKNIPASKAANYDLPDIAIIVLDTVRFDSLFDRNTGQSLQPCLKDFASNARVFLDAHSTSCWTVPAHASILSGLYPNAHMSDQENAKYGKDFPTIPEMLSKQGYFSVGITENAFLGTPTGFGRGFDYYFDAYRALSSLSVKQFKGLLAFFGLSDLKMRFTPSMVKEVVTHPQAENKPMFLFVNLIDPHRPYIPLPENIDTIENKFSYPKDVFLQYRYNLKTWYLDQVDKDKSDLDTLKRLYDLEVEETCRKTKRILSLLKRRDRKSLVFVVSDHGENFGDGGHLDHVFSLQESASHISFVMAGDGIKPGRTTEPVSLVDIFPTIMDAAGIAHEATDGVTLMEPAPMDREIFLSYAFPKQVLGLFSEDEKSSGALKDYLSPIYSVIKNQWKLTWRTPDRLALHNLMIDPSQEHNLIDQRSDISQMLFQLLTKYAKDRKANHSGSLPAMDKQTRENLKSLGYLL